MKYSVNRWSWGGNTRNKAGRAERIRLGTKLVEGAVQMRVFAMDGLRRDALVLAFGVG